MDSPNNGGVRLSSVRILSDDWSIFGQIATVLDPEPVPGSSQILLDLNGDLITLARGEVEYLTPA